MKRNFLTYIVLGITLFFDILTKWFMKNRSIIVIKDFLSLTYTKNYGAAWSIFEGHIILLIIISLVLLGVIFFYSLRFEKNVRNCIAFGLVYGGLFGNLFDRVFMGYVRDFISFQFGNYYYPIFNIADIAIVIGVIFIAIAIIKKEDNYENN